MGASWRSEGLPTADANRRWSALPDIVEADSETRKGIA